MRAAIDKLREIATDLGGVDTCDGLFLNGVADAIEHGDAMDELDGKTLAVVDPRPRAGRKGCSYEIGSGGEVPLAE